ncbi:MAG: hypothetical protein E5Y35_07685 [Mesorhizobium sp.]|nr:MAG: hypothetical protein E5Y35_07685 [Mesorhizobium sp.]
MRFAIGDRLWVREAWRTESRAYDDLAPTDMGGEETVIFEADADWKLNKSVGRLRQGMHMPRWASRLTLIVTEVRVQRLQEISEEDAAAEGLLSWRYQDCDGDPKLDGRPYKATLWHWAQPETEFDGFSSATGAYRDLWDHLNEARGYGWATNPWVIAVSFTVERRNIDVGRP